MDILVDTNVLVRRIRRGNRLSRETRDALKLLRSQGHTLCVTSQNLAEFWAVCTRPIENNGLGLVPAVAERILSRVERAVTRLPDLDSTYAEWRRLVTLHTISGKTTHDARLVAAMNVHGIRHILTFNVDDFVRYGNIQVMHPSRVPQGNSG